MRRFTRDEFVAAARSIHGDKYDYSKVEYKNSATKVCIICPIHGEFMQAPVNHVNQKQGCSKCFHESVKKPVYGHGINDTEYVFETKDYKIWRNMLERCYCEKTQKRFPTYKGCTVCDKWKTFSNFKKWFHEHYIDGWELDKDILFKGNKEYSFDKCCFVPHEINSMFTKSEAKRGDYPIGVSKHGNGFRARVLTLNKTVNIGTYKTAEEAFDAYKRVKEEYIRLIAEKWKEKLNPRVYNALHNYKVEITD